MAGWRVHGVRLPQGEEGEAVVGSGDLVALPGSFAITGLVDAHCHVSVDVGADGRPFPSDRSFADARIEQLAGEVDSAALTSRPCIDGLAD
jgi:imidazolonepropionase-like amidohydrolase